MGRINVPPAVGKRQKNLINGKSFGEFINPKAQGYKLSRILGKSEDDEFIVLGCTKSQGGGYHYAVIYDNEANYVASVRLAYHSSRYIFACVDSEKQLICVDSQAIYRYEFNGNMTSSTSLSTEHYPMGVRHAHFFNDVIYTVADKTANEQSKTCFSKYNKFGDLIYQKEEEGLSISYLFSFWIVNDEREEVLCRRDSTEESVYFDFKQGKIQTSNQERTGYRWRFYNCLPSQGELRPVKALKDLGQIGFYFMHPAGVIFNQEEKEYIFIVEALVGPPGKTSGAFKGLFKIPEDSLSEFEMQILPSKIAGDFGRFSSILFNNKLIYTADPNDFGIVEFLSL